jgi:hypothetical protein
MFADDTSLFTSGPILSEIISTINQEIPLLVDWLRANRLSLNVGKTHLMIFGKRSKPTIDPIDVRIGGTKLDILNSTKFLGVILDANLNWKDHLSHTAKKISKSIGIISIARRNLNQKTLIQLYFAFIFPYLSYCVLIWGNSPAQTLWPVLRLQKIAFRLIANITKRGSFRPFCK